MVSKYAFFALAASLVCGSARAADSAGASQTNCAQNRARLKEAAAALSECLASGGGCAEQFRAKEEAEKAASGCPAEPAEQEANPTGPASTESPQATPPNAPAHDGRGRPAIYLKDGSIIRGDVVQTKDGIMTVVTESGTLSVRQENVQRVEYSPGIEGMSQNTASSPLPPVVAGLSDQEAHDHQIYVDLDLWLGGKVLPTDWAPVDKQSEYGFELSIANRRWGIGRSSFAFVVDYFGAQTSVDGTEATSGDRVHYSASTGEVASGFRWIIRDEALVRPYLGAGIADGIATFAATDQVTGGGGSNLGAGVGFWVQAGAKARIGRYWNLGAEYRYTNLPMTLAGVATNAGGHQFGVTLGVAFGSASTFAP